MLEKNSNGNRSVNEPESENQEVYKKENLK